MSIWYEFLDKYFPKKSHFVMSQLDQYFAAFPLFITPITSKCAKGIQISPPVMSVQFLILKYRFKGLRCWPSEKILWKNISFIYIVVHSFIAEVLLCTPTFPSGCDVVTEETKRKMKMPFCVFASTKIFHVL